MTKKNFFSAFLGGVKEFFRKKIVGLKRNPKVIPLVVMVVGFFVYSLNLSAVSFTVSICQGIGLGLCEFAIMLFSVLSMVCLLNAFPPRKKVNIPMLVLVFVMLGIIIYCDIHCINGIWSKVNDPVSPIIIKETDKVTSKVPVAYDMFNTHLIIECIAAACVALVPVFSKLLNMINTSVAVDDNGDMGEIEISAE